MGDASFADKAVDQVNVHPVVIYSILDHYMRRNEGQVRVIGALLGTRTATTIEIKTAFPVPHVEKGEDEVAVGKEHMRQMYQLHQRVNDNEEIIGWYATADETILVNEQSCLIHDFFTAECSDPLHLVVDTSLKNDTLGVKAFISSPLILGDRALAAAFKQLKVDIHARTPEKIGVDMMIKADTGLGGSTTLNTSMENLEESLETLQSLLETVTSYVENVISGKIQPDNRIGSSIAQVVSMVPRIKPDIFAKSFNSSLHDLLMVVYLSNLTRTQLAIAEKLGSEL